MSFQFIHTADLHLDAPLRAMALRDPALADEIGVASRLAFSRTIDLCISEKVAFLIIAGDLWDGEYSSTKTPRFLKQELLRLRSADIRCYIIRGNHDALARQTGELDLPDNCYLFGAKASSAPALMIDGQKVVLHGLSFRDAHAPDSLLPRYPAPVAQAFNIGVMHTSLNGSPGHDNYAPTSVADLHAHGYDYWALGHIHKRIEVIGPSVIVMPGIPQGRDIGEAGPASVTLVSVADDRSITLTPRSVAPLRFERLAIDCTGITDWPGLLARLEQSIAAAALVPHPEEHLVLRPMLQGITPLSWRMKRDIDRLSEEARSFAADAGVWIDKLEIQTQDALDPRSGADDPSLPNELRAIILKDLCTDPGLMAALLDQAQTFQRYLPADLRGILGEDAAQLAQHCQSLLAEGAPLVLSRLTTGSEEN